MLKKCRNKYVPWDKLGINELEYYQGKYIESRQITNQLQGLLEEIARESSFDDDMGKYLKIQITAETWWRLQKWYKQYETENTI